ncbi:hypothetical protein M2137_002214 [Parabacteroides sp. PFB2-10]|uniref:hypothetical protein n=1 Tax=Parabacteroides sp. PFB2-10 TaxID=1742405 RepID=UPI0024755040|nr:hypothetical protein [Parabacteroides sp. PFB2-10]MDH6313424.1 hypothetical protein [Parabacteroides sp. PFB2-10]
MTNNTFENRLDVFKDHSYQIVDIKSCIVKLSDTEDENKIKRYNFSLENSLLLSKKDSLLNLRTDVAIRGQEIDSLLAKARFEIIFKIVFQEKAVDLEKVEPYIEDIRLYLMQSNFDTIRGLLFEKLKDTPYRSAIIPFMEIQSKIKEAD